MKKIVSVFIKILAAVLLAALIAVLFLNLSTRLKVNKIKKGGLVNSGYSCAVILSGSMEPSVFMNDLLIIKSAGSYSPGDIVTYISSSGSLVTHRIIEVSENGYITQGDANNVPDDEVPAHRILGKAVFVLSGAGMLLHWIFSPVSIVFFACIVLLVWLIVRLVKR